MGLSGEGGRVCCQEELGRGWGRSRGETGRIKDLGGMVRSGAEIGVRGQGGTENGAVAAARPILLLSLTIP